MDTPDKENFDWAQLVAPPKAVDLPFIRASWLDSYKRSPWAGAVPNNLYVETYTQAIDQLLGRGAKLLTVRNASNPELLVGWICYEVLPNQDLVVHFQYTKAPYRRLGVQTSLLSWITGAGVEARWFYTFKTHCSRYFKGATFRPEIARRRDHHGKTH